MLMESAREFDVKSASYDLVARLDTVAELLKSFDGSPVSKSLIRRAALRSVLHLPPNHEANKALELFYKALDQATVVDAERKSQSKVTNAASLIKIWSQARKAIETVTARFLKSSAKAVLR